jgi:hypothetical protein
LITLGELYEESSVFDIAFKGIYAKNEFEILNKFDAESMDVENNEEFINYFKDRLPEDDVFRNTKLVNIKWKSFKYQEKSFYIIYYTYNLNDPEYPSNDVTLLLGITPEEKGILLAPHCVYNSFLFRLKNEIFFYVENTSCGEGAYMESHLYKIDDGFKEIFHKVIPCD